MRRALLLGAGGQLGRAFCQEAAGRCEVTAFLRRQADITGTARLAELVAEHRPDLVVNAAAWNYVDRAEAEREAAWEVNARAPGRLAEICKDAGCLLVHVSTDYVFGGAGQAPYRESDPPAPLSAYGASKLAGEEAVARAGGRALVVRTAWLFGPGGNNFVEKVLRQGREGQLLRVVSDQRGNPTYAGDLARAILHLVERGVEGLVHATNAGSATWHEFAREILRQAGTELEVEPITLASLSSPARRPADSRLDTRALEERGFRMPPWPDALARYLRQRREA